MESTERFMSLVDLPEPYYGGGKPAIFGLSYDKEGQPRNITANYLAIMRNDPAYAGLRYNVLRDAPELVNRDGSVRLWTDADDANSRKHIEFEYGLFNVQKHADAISILFKERSFDPVKEMIDSLEWDGEHRLDSFLAKWMETGDTEYSREVSRLIFAGGIHRAYNPGAKFDDVPVLIGTSQGEGKSTIVRWLAVKDEFYSEATEIDGAKGIEQLEGAWICEFAELLALTKVKEQEAVKAYITRQYDKYRQPYQRRTVVKPRRCCFVGTTNNEHFLKDKTGNRRYYPIKVNSVAGNLYRNEETVREYIRQCWAEARDLYKQGKLPSYAREDLSDAYRAAREDAMEDDWRVGVIEDYLERKKVGDFVCVKELSDRALSPNSDHPMLLTPKESQEIAVIVSKMEGWERYGRVFTEEYGRQRCWKKVSSAPDPLHLGELNAAEVDSEECPF